MALTTSTSSGSQSTTQSPQSSVQPTGFAGGTQSSSVQPGTTTSLLSTNSGGIPLQQTQLSTVSLATSSTVTKTSTSTTTPHHVNGVFLGFAILLFLIAIGMFVTTSRSAKNTTV